MRASLAALSQMNPRRFDLLLGCIGQGRPFTVADLRASVADTTPSLPRDLNALETGGLLIADPPRSFDRQGRPVTYTVAPLAYRAFRDLAAAIESASATRPSPSGTGTASTHG